MAANSASQEGSQSKAIQIGLVAVLLLGAGGIIAYQYVVKGRGGEGQDTTVGTMYLCPTDGTVKTLTAAQFAEGLRTGEVGAREGATGRSVGMYPRCPKCGKRIMVEAVKCQRDGTVFPKVGADGKPGACPKCGWKAPE
jgi:predicted RNA-binding Zn-ribbon protein involved in translation (DUF1610 family)